MSAPLVLCDATAVPSGPPCRGLAVVEVLCGCVHEHLSIRRMCQHHVDMLVHGDLLCLPCHGGDQHCCELVPETRTLVGLEGAAAS